MHHVPSNARVMAGAVSSVAGMTTLLFSAWGAASASTARLWLLLGATLLVHGSIMLSSLRVGGGRASGALLVSYALIALGNVSHSALLADSTSMGHASGIATLIVLALAVLGAGATLVTRSAPGTRTPGGPMGA